VGYLVKDDNDEQAFLKAADLGMFSNGHDDPLLVLQQAFNAHVFERNVLDHCRGNNMDRVVTALDYGDQELVSAGVRDRVFYLIFEKADGDLRKHVKKQVAFDLLWSVTALHNFFVGTSQLHGADVAHNDLKPANALVFDMSLHKVSDLGRATSHFYPADHDGLLCAGDKRFAPPEQL